jgi:acyl carrier protein
MVDRREVIWTIESIIRGTWPSRFSNSEIWEDVLLGEGGLSLDSVDIVEVIYACEKAFDMQVSTNLLKGPPLTIARVAQYFADAG